MADDSKKSTSITGLDSLPILRPNPGNAGGRLKYYFETVEVADDASIGSVYRFFRVGSWMIPASLMIFCDAITAAAADIGLYGASGGAAVDADIFASAQSIATASKTGIECVFESASTDITNGGKPIWQLLGLTQDPMLEYDVAATITTAATDPGTLSLRGLFAH
jgi:hypothetical protein